MQLEGVVCVAVMDVRIMFMGMNEGFMSVFMSVRRLGTLAREVLMLVVRIVDVPMRMGNPLMRVNVLVSFGKMQPQAQRHESAGDCKCRRDFFGPQQNTHGCTDKWSEREISTGPRRSKVAHREHVKNEAQPVAHESHNQGDGNI